MCLLHGRDRRDSKPVPKAILIAPLNVAEGSGCSDGTRRQRYKDALGSARETLANLECAHAAGYIAPLDDELRTRFAHIIGVLVTCAYPRGA